MEIGEHAKTALWLGAGILIFVICLSSGSYLFQTTSDMNSKMYTLIGTTDRNQKVTLKIEHHYTSTGAEVIQTLHQIQELGTAIEVDGQRLDSSIDPDELDVSFINMNRPYRTTYIRDTAGRLMLVKYDISEETTQP